MYRGTIKSFKEYWEAYGKLRAIVTSPYLHAALIFSFFCYGIWSSEDKRAADIAISVLPNLIGFSIGAFAILTQMSSNIEILNEKIDGQYFRNILSSSFVHAVIMQTFAIMIAILIKSNLGTYLIIIYGDNHIIFMKCLSILLRGFGFMIFSYSILLSISLVFVVFRLINFSSPHDN